MRPFTCHSAAERYPFALLGGLVLAGEGVGRMVRSWRGALLKQEDAFRERWRHVVQRCDGERRELLGRIDEEILQVFDRLDVPSREEVGRLNRKVMELTDKVQRLVLGGAC